MANTERYASHPVRLRPDHKSMCIPIGIHGDGVQVVGVGRTWSKGVEAFSWTSLLALGATVMINFVIWVCFSKCMCTSDDKHTMRRFWSELKWSLSWLEKGVWPTTDSSGKLIRSKNAGTPLAGGYYAVVWLLKGDLDYFSKTFNLEAPASGHPCVRCPCNTTTIPWTDIHPDTSAWIPLTWKHTDWMPAHPDAPCIFELEGLTIDAVSPDWMHCKHLGADQYLFGSVLMLLCFHILPNRPEQNMGQIWTELKAAATGAGGFSEIKTSMFVPPPEKFPSLKGKANEIKRLAGPLSQVWQKYYSVADKQHRLVRLALLASVELDLILDRHEDDFVLGGDDARRFKDLCFQYTACVSSLGSHYHTRGMWLFHFTIKTHYLLHLGLLCTEVNPRISWCYQGEDLMDKIKTLTQSVARGSSPQRMVAKIMHKYQVGLSYYMLSRHRWWK